MTREYTLDWDGAYLLVNSGSLSSRISPNAAESTLMGDGTIQWYVTGNTGWLMLSVGGLKWIFWPTTYYSGGTYQPGEMVLEMDAVTGKPAIFLGDTGGYGYMFQDHPLSDDTCNWGACTFRPPKHVILPSGLKIAWDRQAGMGSLIDPDSWDWGIAPSQRGQTLKNCIYLDGEDGYLYEFWPDSGPQQGSPYIAPGTLTSSLGSYRLYGYGGQCWTFSTGGHADP